MSRPLVEMLGSVADLRSLSLVCRETREVYYKPKHAHFICSDNLSRMVVDKFGFEKIHTFNAWLVEHKAILGGSGALQVILGEDWSTSDLDVYFSYSGAIELSKLQDPILRGGKTDLEARRNYVNAVAAPLLKLGYRRAGINTRTIPAPVPVLGLDGEINTFAAPDTNGGGYQDVDFFDVFSLYKGSLTVQLIFCQNTAAAVEDSIRSYDLSFLKSFWDGKAMNMMHPLDTLTRTGRYNPATLHKLVCKGWLPTAQRALLMSEVSLAYRSTCEAVGSIIDSQLLTEQRLTQSRTELRFFSQYDKSTLLQMQALMGVKQKLEYFLPTVVLQQRFKEHELERFGVLEIINSSDDYYERQMGENSDLNFAVGWGKMQFEKQRARVDKYFQRGFALEGPQPPVELAPDLPPSMW